MTRAPVALIALALACGCGDDEHKGTISHGPTATPSGSAASVKKVRLVYQPKSPVATMRVAKVARKRLAGTGADVTIGGATVEVDVVATKAEAVKKLMAGGRIDLWLAAEATLAVPEGLEGIAVEHETIDTAKGNEARTFLRAEAKQRKTLVKLAKNHHGAAKILVGPAGAPMGPARTFAVNVGKRVRGEYVASARAEPHPKGARLVVAFDGSGRNFIRWNSKHNEGFVLQVDGSVLGRIRPDDIVKDGTLAFVLKGWSLAQAKAVAKSIDGIALSHLTVLEDEEPH